MKESSKESDMDEFGELYIRDGDGGLLWSKMRLAIVNGKPKRYKGTAKDRKRERESTE
jgi:hypothetical protein